MKTFWFIIVVLFGINAQIPAQNPALKIRVDSLALIDSNWNDCNSVFWRVIALGKPAVPLLIDKLTDTTITNAKDRCESFNFCVGDLSYLALKEMIDLPFFVVTGMQCDVITAECEFDPCQRGYIASDRARFQTQVRKWYAAEEKNLRWIQFSETEATPCYTYNHIVGHYAWRSR